MTSVGTIEDGAAGAVSHHAYPASAMLGDYLRAAAGLVPAGLLLVTVPIGLVPGVILGGFATVFAVFGVKTALRHQTRLEMSDTELRSYGAVARSIPWAELDRFRLAYYSTRRDRRSGWMQLELGAGGKTLGLDSRIEGFDRVVRYAALVADERGLALSEATAANLESLGIGMAKQGEGW